MNGNAVRRSGPECVRFFPTQWTRTSSVVLICLAITMTVEGEDPAPRTFRVWATSCSHVPADIRRGRESLAEAIRHSEGRVDGAPELRSAIRRCRVH